MRQLRALGRATALAYVISSFLFAATTGPAALAAPSVEIVSPQNGAIVVGSVLIEISYKSDGVNPVRTLQIFLNGQEARSYDLRPPRHEGKQQFRYDFRFTAPTECRIAARALDTGGQPGTTAIRVTVQPDRALASGGRDTTPPKVDIYQPAQGAAVSGTLELVADVQDESGIASVIFFIDGRMHTIIMKGGPYTASLDTSKLDDGRHVARAVAEDTAGNEGQTERVFTVANTREVTVAQTPQIAPEAVGPRVAALPQVAPSEQPTPGSPFPQPPPATTEAPGIQVRPTPKGPEAPPPTPPLPQGVSVQQATTTVTPPVLPASEAAPPETTYGRTIALAATLPDAPVFEEVSIPPDVVPSPLAPTAPASGLGLPRLGASSPTPTLPPTQREQLASVATGTARGDISPALPPASPEKVTPAAAAGPEPRQPAAEPPSVGLGGVADLEATSEPVLPGREPRVVMRPLASVDPSIAPSVNPGPAPAPQTESLTAGITAPPCYTARAELALRSAPVAMLPTAARAASLERGRMTVPEAQSVAPVAVTTSQIRDIRVCFDGQDLPLRTAPVVVDGVSLGPLREIFEHTDGVLYWYGVEKRVEAVNADTRIELKIGDPTALVNSQKTTMVLAPFIKNGRTMVPLEFLAAALNVTVQFNQETGQIRITSNEF